MFKVRLLDVRLLAVDTSISLMLNFEVKSGSRGIYLLYALYSILTTTSFYLSTYFSIPTTTPHPIGTSINNIFVPFDAVILILAVSHNP